MVGVQLYKILAISRSDPKEAGTPHLDQTASRHHVCQTTGSTRASRRMRSVPARDIVTRHGLVATVWQRRRLKTRVEKNTLYLRLRRCGNGRSHGEHTSYHPETPARNIRSSADIRNQGRQCLGGCRAPVNFFPDHHCSSSNKAHQQMQSGGVWKCEDISSTHHPPPLCVLMLALNIK
ncbi:hypothetical protein D3C72_1561240 [compost metagenome]